MTQSLDTIALGLTGTGAFRDALALGSSVAMRVEKLVDDYMFDPSFARWLVNGATNWVDYDVVADPLSLIHI